MVSLTCHTRRIDEVTLVEVLVTSETPTRVRVANRLDGPVWPPRTQGVPAEGWDGQEFEGVVDDRLVFGYATPATPTGSPAELVSTAPVEHEGELTPADIVRSLGDPRPPRDAIESPSVEPASQSTNNDPPLEEPSPPPALTEWLDGIERRLATADDLAAASSVSEASEAVAAVGGPDDVLALREQLVADRRALARVQSRCRTLSDRAAGVDIPAETLTRLA